jgi:DNA-directed RNA polymerase sigma subunit (sigma70/sigma32)
MGLYDRPTRRKRLNNTDPSWDRHDGCDPQIAERLFVQLCVDPPDRSDYDEAAEAPEPDRDLLNALRDCMWNVLSRQERYVLIQRVLVGDTYATIAKTAWPRLRDRSHAHEIEQQALAKLRNRLKYYKS